ncbi:hypothetical protein SHKM778_86700 [Streptomyces sp. KM77-8]|uniref:Uncharacterized protein n=1 Tax=Streptomyces haneummycinicus TaxID=3074435 RepID=A0AAT9HXF6_9ACTN
MTLSGPRSGRRAYQVPAARHLDGISVDETGRASAVVVRGSLYWLTHRDGPARTLTDTPGVRVRLPEMLGAGDQVAYVTDAEGEDAVEIASCPGPPASALPGGWPRAGWAGCWRWWPTRRGSGWPSPRTTAGCS